MAKREEYPPEIMEAANARVNEAVARAREKARNNPHVIDPTWASRKTESGRNYNAGKYDSPYMEDNGGKAAIMGFFLALVAIVFFNN